MVEEIIRDVCRAAAVKGGEGLRAVSVRYFK